MLYKKHITIQSSTHAKKRVLDAAQKTRRTPYFSRYASKIKRSINNE